MKKRKLFFLTLVLANLSCNALTSPPQAAESLPILFRDDFQQGMHAWVAADAGLPREVWSIEAAPDGSSNCYLRAAGKSDYQPPFRSPFSLAVLRDVVVSDFELTAQVQNTNVEAGDHRDLCLFWGFQDPAHFYYVHLGARPDPHSSQLFIVDGAPRKKITENLSPGVPWTEGWHQVKVTYQTETGRMQVFFDDMQTPRFVAHDKTFVWGRIGLGSFDDHGNFDDVLVRGKTVQPVPAEAKLP
jgi:hypothetical protein